MFGLDHLVESPDSTVALVLTVAVLLGLRHAADPDHLAAVSILIAGDEEPDPRTAARLGAAWGLGHASTLCAFGLPVILVGAGLPPGVRRAGEVAVGVVIIVLAIRLLARWRRGRFHTHTHTHPHGGPTHRHLHIHAHAADHAHAHVTGPGRTRAQAYVIGLLHGVGGSAGAGVLLLASLPGPALGISALVIFALGTAISMAAASFAFGYVITRDSPLRYASRVTPLLGAFGAAFGTWYLLGALVP